MTYPIYENRKSNLTPDNMFFEFDCGDLWVRKDVCFQDDLDACFDKSLEPSISDLSNEIEKFQWKMTYTIPYPEQIDGLKLNQNYKIKEGNNYYTCPIIFNNKKLTILNDLMLNSPETIIDLINKFKNVEIIRFEINTMSGDGTLELLEDDDEYFKVQLNNQSWWTSLSPYDDKTGIEDLKKIKKGINPKIKFDYEDVSDEDISILKKEGII